MKVEVELKLGKRETFLRVVDVDMSLVSYNFVAIKYEDDTNPCGISHEFYKKEDVIHVHISE